jgi:PAS domain S-box-containing protein
VRFLEIPLDFRGLTSIYIDIPALRPGTVGSYFFAVLCTLAAFALRLAIDPHVIGAEYITFFPAVSAATLVSGLRAGFVSVVLSFAAVIFLLPPRLSFYVANPAEFPALALFVLVMVFEVLVAAGMRLALERYHELSLHLEERVEARTAEALLHSRHLDAAYHRLQQVNDELMAVYDQGLYAAHLDMDGKVFRATRACVEGCGFMPGEIIGKPFWECGWFNKPETQAWVRNGFERAASGVPFRGEVDYVFRNGTEHTSETAFIPIKDDGRVAFVFVPGLDITERIRQYRATFETAAVGIAHLTPDLQWRRVNETITRITGFSAAELAMKTMPEITHPDDVGVTLAQVEQVREGKAASYDIEKRYVRKDGTTTWVRAAANAVRTGDGSVDHFVLVVQDISASKQAEQLLQRQADLLNQSHDAILTMRTDRRDIAYWSHGAEKMYGYTAAEAAGCRTHELLQTRAPIPIEDIDAQVIQQGSWYGELTHTTRDGREIVVESRIVRVSYDGDKYELETNRDITERKSAEDALRKNEERFRSSIIHSPVPTMLFDDREQILAVSESWLKSAGVSAGELHRMEDWTIRAYGERSDEVLQLIREGLAMPTEPEGRTDELMILTGGGDKRIWKFVTSGVGTLSDGRRLFISAAIDLTDQRSYEERIRLLMREARHRTKNILGLVQAIARQTAAGDAQDFIGRFTERIQALAANQDLLVRHDWQRIDVKDLVQAQLGHFADLIGTRINFNGPKLRLNAAAAQAIGLALHELATNASKYGALSTGDGHVDVDWQIDRGKFAMNWTEREGPPVKPPERRGFGTLVIDSMAQQSINGEVQLDYRPSGLAWRLRCPAENALEATASESRAAVSG